MVAHRRGPWMQNEDNHLMQLVSVDGPKNWVQISAAIGTRSPKQCRERYHQNLKPTLNHSPITPEEGEQIERMVQEMGKRWAEIARRLHGRSDNAVKNWWNGGMNKRKRNSDRHRHSSSDQNQPSQNMYSPMETPRDAIATSHHPVQNTLPPLVNMSVESHESLHDYSASRRSSHTLSINSPQMVQLPLPHTFQPQGAARPQPLNLQFNASRPVPTGRLYETPMPSPSGYSTVSADGAPSLITDTGSEPRGAASPLDLTLAPIGARDERRDSTQFAIPHLRFEEDGHHYLPSPYGVDSKRRASVQLPPLARDERVLSTTQRGPTRPTMQLLTQPASRDAHQPSQPLPAGQRPLPAFHTLVEPDRRMPSQTASAIDPSTRSEYFHPFHTTRSGATSEPTSPRTGLRDNRMNLANMLS